MAQNKLSNLSNHLFAQMERVTDESLTKEQIDIEIKRSKMVTEISKNIINIGNLSVEVLKLKNTKLSCKEELPNVLKFSE